MFDSESVKILIALGTIAAVFLVMQFRRGTPTEVLFCLALGIYVLSGVLTPERAWLGFADPAVIAIAGLLVVSSALRTSGVLDRLGRRLLGRVGTEKGALSRLSGVVIASSAFLLNTAIVAMLMPLAIYWCRQRHIAPSRILLPISYLAILGGTCTLVGTSTNFVVNGILSEVTEQIAVALPPNASSATTESSLRGYSTEWLSAYQSALVPMTLTDITWVGVPCALTGLLVLLAFGKHLLPDRREMLDSLEEQRREYLVEMTVAAGCGLIGKSVEEGGLRHLPGLFLIEIDRKGSVLAPVAPTDLIEENDRLVFTGIVATIVDLEKIPGLVPAADMNYEISQEKNLTRSLVEVVLSPSSPLVGRSIRNANFRQLYNAAVVAVHRNGERLPTKIGDIELTSGDTLLLQTQPGFVKSFRNRPDFYLVSGVEDGDSRRHDKLAPAVVIVLGLIAWLFLMPLFPTLLQPIYGSELPGFLTSPTAAIFVAALCVIVTRCLSVSDARSALDLPMLLTIGAAIGVGRGMHDSGAAALLATRIVDLIGDNPYVALVAVFAVTICLTEMVSNVAVAAMMISIAIGVASNLEVNPRPFIMAVTLAASLSFISPIGYQTNLMVMGPGGYRPIDYVRAGLPLSIAVSVVALILIPILWPFS
ncbi:MAG: SLC13 family permease [bacterium]|nr:SLC13 family permease [bacterium]